MDRPIILCIVGESGVGKTTVADYIADMYGWEMIESRTTRPPRTPGETGHTFVSEEEFATYKPVDMIAYTIFGSAKYCCLKKDVHLRSLYVIDEFGLKYLKENYSDDYNIISLRIHRDKDRRIDAVGEERVARDEGKFTMLDHEFDYVIPVHSNDVLRYVLERVDYIMSDILDRHV